MAKPTARMNTIRVIPIRSSMGAGLIGVAGTPVSNPRLRGRNRGIRLASPIRQWGSSIGTAGPRLTGDHRDDGAVIQGRVGPTARASRCGWYNPHPDGRGGHSPTADRTSANGLLVVHVRELLGASPLAFYPALYPEAKLRKPLGGCVHQMGHQTMACEGT